MLALRRAVFAVCMWMRHACCASCVQTYTSHVTPDTLMCTGGQAIYCASTLHDFSFYHLPLNPVHTRMPGMAHRCTSVHGQCILYISFFFHFPFFSFPFVFQYSIFSPSCCISFPHSTVHFISFHKRLFKLLS